MAKRRALAPELIVGLVLLFLMGTVYLFLSPVLYDILNNMQVAMGANVDPGIFNTIKTMWSLSILAILGAIVIYILTAGMRRNPGYEYQ